MGRAVSQHLLSRAFANTSAPMMIVDTRTEDHPLIYVNQAFETLTGYERKKILGRNRRFLQNDYTDQPGHDEIREAVKASRPCTVRLRNYWQDGSLFLNEFRLAPIFDETGAVSHFVGCPALALDQNFPTSANRAISRLVTLTDREKSVLSLLLDGLANKEAARNLKISHRTVEKHRSSILGKMEASNLMHLSRIVTSMELERAEEETRESEFLLHAILEGVTDGVWIKDTERRYRMWNQAGARFFGMEAVEFVGKNDLEVFPADIAQKIMADDAEILESGQEKTAKEVHTLSGLARTFETKKGPCRDVNGQVLALIGIFQEVTEHKSAHEQMRSPRT